MSCAVRASPKVYPPSRADFELGATCVVENIVVRSVQRRQIQPCRAIDEAQQTVVITLDDSALT